MRLRRSGSPRMRAPVPFGANLLCVLLIVLPVLMIGWMAAHAFVERLDAILSKSAPIVSAELSRTLRTEVRIARLTPNLTVSALWSMFQNRNSLGTLPIIAEEVAIANGTTIEGSGTLGTASRVRMFLSVPTLLTGDFTAALSRVIVESPDVLLVRNAEGRLNVQDIFPQQPKKTQKKPFRTVVEIQNGRLRFQDYAAKLPRSALPAINYFSQVSGVVDLTGTRTVSYEASAQAQEGTATARRLGGTLIVRGSSARGKPDQGPFSPAKDAPMALVFIGVRDASIPYWLDYAVDIPDFSVTQGRADADLTLAVERPAREGEKAPEPQVNGTARFSNVAIASPKLPVSVGDATGTARFDNASVSYQLSAGVLGERLSSEGTVWNLPRPGVTTKPVVPELAVTVSAPRIPIQRVLAALPKGNGNAAALPPGMSISGVGSLNTSVYGPANNPIVVAQASVPRVVYRDLPPISNIRANLTYASGVVGVTRVTAGIAGGGDITGKLALRIGEPNPEGGPLEILPPERQSAAFAADISNVDLARLTMLQQALARSSGSVRQMLRLRGIGSVEVVGSLAGRSLTAAANVTTQGLRLGDIPFPTATARVLVQNNRVMVPAARIVSPAGVVGVTGDVAQNGRLALRFSAAGLDLTRLGDALGQPSLAGRLNITGRVGGTVQDPRVSVDQLLGLNLRYKTYEIDMVRGSLTATRSRVVLGDNVMVRRFPAEVRLAGQVTNLDQRGGRPPQLDLRVRASNIDYAEVERQIRAASEAVAQASGRPAANQQVALARPPFVGFVRDADVRVTGPATRPNIVGRANVERMLLGDYPVEGGTVEFAYVNGRARITNATLNASIGSITGNADVSPTGQLSGSFQARNLDLERLSFLTERFAALEGSVTVEGTFSGTQTRPIVTVDILPSDVTVAGLRIADLTAENVQVVFNTKEGAGRITAPSLSFRHAGSRFAATNNFFDLKTRRVATTVSVQIADIGVLVDSLRNSRLSDTRDGAQLIASLNRLPDPVGGQLTLDNLTARARLAEEGVQDLAVSGSVAGKDLRVGQFTADSLALAASMNGDVITLTEARLVSARTTITAGGTIDPDGVVNLTLESNEADLELVRAFSPSFPLRGTMDLTVRVTGQTKTPTVDASLFGRNILLARPGPTSAEASTAVAVQAVAGDAVPDPNVPAQEAPSQPGETQPQTPAAEATAKPTQPGLILNLVRAQARLEAGRTPADPARIVVSEILVTSGEGEFRAEGFVPFSYETFTVMPNQPLEVRAEIPRRDISLFVALAGGLSPNFPVTDLRENIKGTIDASIAVEGTLREPRLSGGLVIADGQILNPRLRGSDRDNINPVRDMDAVLRFEGGNIIVDTFKIALGGPNNPGANFGDLSVTGSIALTDLQALLETRDAQRSAAERLASGNLAGQYDLTAAFNNLRVEENDLANMGEEVRARVNGTMRITGDLLEPTVSTAPGAPLVLSDGFVQMPTKSVVGEGGGFGLPINPRFNLAIEIDKRAVIANQNAFRFEANGSIIAEGSLLEPDVRARLVALGGFYQYAIARFNVVKGGEIAVDVTPATGPRGNASQDSPFKMAVRLNELTAKTTLYVPEGVSLAPTSRIREGGMGAVGSGAPLAAGRTSRYRITIEINGGLQIGESINSQPARITFTSDPPLDQSQIIALLGTQQQIEMAARGDVQGATKLLFEQAVQSALVPQLLAPIQTSLANALGFEELSLDYNPNLPLTLRLLKRLPDPLDRFLFSYTRQLQARNVPGAPQPFEVSLYYEIYQLNISERIQPRLQLGVSTNEQQDRQIFVRGTVSY